MNGCVKSKEIGQKQARCLKLALMLKTAYNMTAEAKGGFA